MANPVALVPLPQSVEWTDETWEGATPWDALRVQLVDDLKPGAYELTITDSEIMLRAGSERALADGKNTFVQLIDGQDIDGIYYVPGVKIEDAPKYAWRGVMIDVARHFLPLNELKVMIDALALHRFNVLHLHLTDDQGWRIQIDGYPFLTDIGAWRDQTLVGHQNEAEAEPESTNFDNRKHGGFYTQAEIRDLVEYAAERGVTIVPEIDLPGHVQSALAAYPRLGVFPDRDLKVRETWGISEHVLAPTDEAFRFVSDVLAQVCQLFPGPYIHIGGDECPTVEWDASPETPAYLQEHGLTRSREIQGRFTELADMVLHQFGKRLVGWDEILDAHLPDDSVVMVWQSDKDVSAATSRGFQAIVADSNCLYLDYYQAKPKHEPLAIGGLTTLKDVYNYQVVPADLSPAEKHLILGVQAQLWSEYLPTAEQLQYMAFPRLCAVAELAWGSPRTSYRDFLNRLRPHLDRLERRGLNYRSLD